MPDNVKIYDRPDRKKPSPLILVIVLLVILAVAFFAYRALHHTPPAPVKVQTGLRPISGMDARHMSVASLAPSAFYYTNKEKVRLPLKMGIMPQTGRPRGRLARAYTAQG